MNAPNRFLLHTIDATTYTARRDKGASWAGTFGVLSFVLLICTVLLWADRAFV